jgi:hypothetical protein
VVGCSHGDLVQDNALCVARWVGQNVSEVLILSNDEVEILKIIKAGKFGGFGVAVILAIYLLLSEGYEIFRRRRVVRTQRV